MAQRDDADHIISHMEAKTIASQPFDGPSDNDAFSVPSVYRTRCWDYSTCQGNHIWCTAGTKRSETSSGQEAMRIDNVTPMIDTPLDPATSEATALVHKPTRDRHRNPTEHPENSGEDRTPLLIVQAGWCMQCFSIANYKRVKSLQATHRQANHLQITLPTCQFIGSTCSSCNGGICYGPAGLMAGDAMDCARIVEFIKSLFHRAVESDHSEPGLLLSQQTREGFVRLVHDLCVAFESVERQHCVENNIFNRPPTKKYRRRLRDQRVLLATQFPYPVPDPKFKDREPKTSAAKADLKTTRRLWQLYQLPRLDFFDGGLFLRWQEALSVAYFSFWELLRSDSRVSTEDQKRLLRQFPAYPLEL
ncbi:uncharacterized protein Triagg1_1380 [Trichoderma aggressivum f. europaeum]|uniref:Uncharacterized protein n=1 Tax=Trichoderma aggressivum f. europaeum TaxID=173218 RepID=A0AAE1JDQ3_9HYPO|nr:hypothetical protein Triagg1_1380 [Trichoderma aggressivum f. europaeum]